METERQTKESNIKWFEKLSFEKHSNYTSIYFVELSKYKSAKNPI